MKKFYVYTSDKKVTLSKNDGQKIQLSKGDIFAVEYGSINDVYRIKPELLDKLLGLCSEFDTSKVIGTFAKSTNGLTGKVESVNNDGTVNLYIGNKVLSNLQDFVPSTEDDYIKTIKAKLQKCLDDANFYRKEGAEYVKKFKGGLDTLSARKHREYVEAWKSCKKEAEYYDSLLPKKEYKERKLKLNIQSVKFNLGRGAVGNIGFDPQIGYNTNVFAALNISSEVLNALGWEKVFLIPGVPARAYAELIGNPKSVEFLCEGSDDIIKIINKKLSEI